MPYKLRKARNKPLYWVIDNSGKKYEKEPIPLERAKKQLVALHIHTKHGGSSVVDTNALNATTLGNAGKLAAIDAINKTPINFNTGQGIDIATQNAIKAYLLVYPAQTLGILTNFIIPQLIENAHIAAKTVADNLADKANLAKGLATRPTPTEYTTAENAYYASMYNTTGGSIWSSVVDTVNKIPGWTTSLVSNKYTTATQNWINKNKDNTVRTLTVRRAPIAKGLTLTFDLITAGRWSPGVKAAGYDNMYHLSMVITNQDGKPSQLEKLANLNYTDTVTEQPDTVYRNIPVPSGIIIGEMLAKTHAAMGDDKYFKYDAFSYNCQNFIYNLLKANGMGTQADYDWLLQPISVLLANEPGFLPGLAKTVTNIGAIWGTLFGGGEKRPTLHKDGDKYSIQYKGRIIARFETRKGAIEYLNTLTPDKIKEIDERIIRTFNLPSDDGSDEELRGGNLPSLQTLYQISVESYSDTPKSVENWNLIASTPTLKFFQNDRTIIVGIRGTNANDFRDIKADVGIAFNTLKTTKRYKADFKDLSRFEHRGFTYYGVGHSLGGAILDALIDDGLIEKGVSFNPAVEPLNLRNDSYLKNRRIYITRDPLYRTEGFLAKGAEVRIGNEGEFAHNLSNFKDIVGGGHAHSRPISSVTPEHEKSMVGFTLGERHALPKVTDQETARQVLTNLSNATSDDLRHFLGEDIKTFRELVKPTWKQILRYLHPNKGGTPDDQAKMNIVTALVETTYGKGATITGSGILGGENTWAQIEHQYRKLARELSGINIPAPERYLEIYNQLNTFLTPDIIRDINPVDIAAFNTGLTHDNILRLVSRIIGIANSRKNIRSSTVRGGGLAHSRPIMCCGRTVHVEVPSVVENPIRRVRRNAAERIARHQERLAEPEDSDPSIQDWETSESKLYLKSKARKETDPQGGGHNKSKLLPSVIAEGKRVIAQDLYDAQQRRYDRLYDRQGYTTIPRIPTRAPRGRLVGIPEVEGYGKKVKHIKRYLKGMGIRATKGNIDKAMSACDSEGVVF